jgi:SAM-dependent methyltransferase
VDLGGGCGGWIRYLKDHGPGLFAELALADSSIPALTLAANVVGSAVKRYQVDLLSLPWRGRWDVAFLLDVLEHIPDDVEVLRQIRTALRPGGLLLVTTPALDFFRTYNDDLIHHVHRYSRKDFSKLATSSGLELCFARYFMFFLSPLLLLSRIRSPDLRRMTEEQIREHLMRSHRVPSWPVNQALRFVFSLETPLGVWLPFPWGTSILAVLRKER